jgi:predicted RNase H-like nuclease (RuvC/YqgF family)
MDLCLDLLTCLLGNAEEKNKVKNKHLRDNPRLKREARQQARYGNNIGREDPKIREMKRRADGEQRALEKLKDDLDTARKSREDRRKKEIHIREYEKHRTLRL